jgi:hypothetical protein
MLWKVTHLNKYGHFKTRIHSTTGPLTLNQGFGPVVSASRFKYESRSPFIGLLPLKGKLYLTPDWIEVHPDTTLDDIQKQEMLVVEKAPQQQQTWEFKSSSSDEIYTTRQWGSKLSCNCPGYYRAKDRKCKHIKQVENGQK